MIPQSAAYSIRSYELFDEVFRIQLFPRRLLQHLIPLVSGTRFEHLFYEELTCRSVSDVAWRFNDVVVNIVDLAENGNSLSAWDFMPSHVTKILVNLDPVDSI